MMRIAFISLLLLFASAANAQTSKSENEIADSFYLLAPVEVRAIRLSANAPFAKTNISKTELETKNVGLDIPMLLQQTPSLVATSDAGNGVGYTGIRIRGSDASRINITLNGIPYNDAESQGTFFVDLPDVISSVNSIQIQRGVGGSTIGGGALGANININTNVWNKAKYFELNNSGGSYATLKSSVKFGSGLIKNHFILDGRISYITSKGYIDRAFSRLGSCYFSVGYLFNKSSLRFNFLSGKEKTYQAWYGIDEQTLKTNRRFNPAGTEKSLSEPYKNQTDNYWQNHYQLFFNHSINKNWKLSNVFFLTYGKGYYEEYKASQNPADYGIETFVQTTTDLVRQLWLKNYFYGEQLSFQFQNKKSDVKLSSGWTIYDGKHFNDVVWTAIIPSMFNQYGNYPAKKYDANIFAVWQYKITEHWHTFADVQYRFVNYTMNGFDNNRHLIIKRQFNFVNPKLGISYLNNSLKAYASVALGNKEPNRDDFQTSPQSQPKAESLLDIEWGVQKSFKKFFGSINCYAMIYKNQLVLTGKLNDVGAYTRINVPNSYRLGIEFVGQYEILKWLKLSGNFTLSKNKIKSFAEFIDCWDTGWQTSVNHHNTDITLSPNIIGELGIEFLPNKKIKVEILNNYVGKQYLDNTQNNSKRLPEYFFTTLRGNYFFDRGWFKKSSLILQINNLLNKKFVTNGWAYSYENYNEIVFENGYYPSATINFLVGLNFKL